MPQATYDPSSKWLLEFHGKGILFLAGDRQVKSCRAGPPEVVQPRKLPDGLLEVIYGEKSRPSLVLVEVATYSEERVVKQVTDGIRLVRQVRGVLPEALVLVLCPKGQYRVPSQHEEKSPQGWTSEVLTWKVVEVWTLSAEDLLSAGDVGVVPWAILARFDGKPEVLLRRCPERIDKEAGDQRANLLAVCQVFARLHFDKPELLEIFGGRNAMIDSPLIQEIGAEFAQTAQVKDILHILEKRLEPASPNIIAGLNLLKNEEKLRGLLLPAATCKTLAEFEEKLRQELPAPAPASTRGKRKPKKSTP